MIEELVVERKVSSLEKEVSEERNRLSSDRMDISFGELINLYKNDELIIRPDYQRLFRWNLEQKTAFIESILLGIPIPPIFVAEDENGVWELIDGLQRVSTFISFFGELKKDVTSITKLEDDEDILYDDYEAPDLGNKWKLMAGSLVKGLNGFSIDTLPPKFKINLKRAVCRVEILRGESKMDMKYELFKRLNSGGSKATPQEIRNAIFRAVNPKLSKLITELSSNKKFIKLTALTSQKRRELYDQELVLKFIAFFNNIEDINDNTERYLDDFMKKSTEDDSFDSDYYRDMFNKVIDLIDELNDEHIFKTKATGGLFIPSEFEGIMIGAAKNFDYYRNNLEVLRSRISDLKKDEDFKKYSGSLSNSKNRIKKRLARANQIFSNIS